MKSKDIDRFVQNEKTLWSLSELNNNLQGLLKIKRRGSVQYLLGIQYGASKALHEAESCVPHIVVLKSN